MKLYFSPGACSFSPHVVLREAGLKFDLEKVNLGEHKTAHGSDFYGVNPKGYVPTLELDNGEILTEGPAIVQYIADQKPEAKLAPPNGTLERVRLQEWLNFISTELHKQFSPLFSPTVADDYKAGQRDKISKRFAWVDKKLEGKDFLLGSQFSVADAYLFTILVWAKGMKVDFDSLKNLSAYYHRIEERPSVVEARAVEKGKA